MCIDMHAGVIRPDGARFKVSALRRLRHRRPDYARDKNCEDPEPTHAKNLDDGVRRVNEIIHGRHIWSYWDDFFPHRSAPDSGIGCSLPRSSEFRNVLGHASGRSVSSVAFTAHWISFSAFELGRSVAL